MGLAGGLEPVGGGEDMAHVSFLLRKTCQQKLDRYHRFFVPFLSRGGSRRCSRPLQRGTPAGQCERFNRPSRGKKGGEERVQVRGYSEKEEEREGGGKSEIK